MTFPLEPNRPPLPPRGLGGPGVQDLSRLARPWREPLYGRSRLPSGSVARYAGCQPALPSAFGFGRGTSGGRSCRCCGMPSSRGPSRWSGGWLVRLGGAWMCRDVARRAELRAYWADRLAACYRRSRLFRGPIALTWRRRLRIWGGFSCERGPASAGLLLVRACCLQGAGADVRVQHPANRLLPAPIDRGRRVAARCGYARLRVLRCSEHLARRGFCPLIGDQALPLLAAPVRCPLPVVTIPTPTVPCSCTPDSPVCGMLRV